MSTISDNVNLEQSHFPVTIERGGGSCLSQSIEIDVFWSHESNHSRWFSRTWAESLQAAWAILLSKYLRSESVSFAVFSGYDYRQKESTKQDTRYCDSDTRIRICQYRVSDAGRFENARLEGSWDYSSVSFKGTQINTAIDFVEQISAEKTRKRALLESTIDQLDLKLEVSSEMGNYHRISLGYRKSTVSTQYAQAIAKSLHFILENGASRNEVTIDLTSVLTSEDHQSILSWNPETLYAQMTCMHHLVEAVARSMPQAEAISSWDGSLSYSQLNNLSSVAACRLSKLGVVPGIFVPFAFEKSLWTVVATLAILKAGGAFVPLDPHSPVPRLKEIITSTGAELILCSETFASKFSSLVNRVAVISERTVAQSISANPHNLFSTAVHPSDPIFVLFTSGSTGQPKGMVHEHGAICTHAISHGETMGYHGARVLQFAAHTFDVAIIDIFTTLIFGGCICIPSDEDRKSNIIGAIHNMKADYAIFTPSFARVIKPSEVPTLKTLAVGGEALPPDVLRQWLDSVSVIQIYGPAEVGICLSIEMRPNQTRAETVGFPLPNCSCWLVDPDDSHTLVPVGAIGELVVAGPSIAREYLNDEAKTRASFLESPPWAKNLGLERTRFFKTGDLLRYNTDSFDGSFDFVGRIDQQIKLRGQRLEPGEIEHHVARIPGVAIPMVTRPDCGYFKGQLVLVVEMHSEASSQVRNEPILLLPRSSLTLEHVKEHLSKFLPSYMVPTVCLVVRSLPFVPSLKINRKKVESWLASMVMAPGELIDASVGLIKSPPLDPSDITALQLSWKVAEILSQPSIQGHDFSLQAAGVDSIQIISFSIFLQETYKINLPMKILLNSKITIRDLAVIIDERGRGSHMYGMSQCENLLGEYEATSRELLGRLDQYQDIRPQRRVVENVLVTGASGYLGSAILRNLLEKSRVNVFALIHCNHVPEGLQRLISSAQKAGWWKGPFAARLQVWKGNLSEMRLGLSQDQYDDLVGATQHPRVQIHAIIHSGAKVHYSSDFTSLKATNITSTAILLEAAALSPYLSTFVFVCGGTQPDVKLTLEQISGPRKSEIDQADGYAKTKIVSELIVARCAGHPAYSEKQIFAIKPGYIVGSLENGISNKSDFIWRLISGCVEVGAYNRGWSQRWLFIADVDLVAEKVVAPLFSGQQENFVGAKTERVLDGLHFADLWELLQLGFGFQLEALDFGDWMKRMKDAIFKKGENHQLFPLMHVLDQDGAAIGSADAPSYNSTAAKERVRAVLKRNVQHLIDVGFISH